MSYFLFNERYFILEDGNYDFPNPIEAADGIVAVGGEITPKRLLSAYENGIFPWYDESMPVLWQSPLTRFVLPLEKLHIGKSMRKWMKRNPYRITSDTCFSSVIEMCGKIERKGQRGTWITPDIVNGYCKLFDLGYAHSVECWLGGVLVGGLYGVSLGNYFFGESMFSYAENASKTAFITLTNKMPILHLDMIDCQVYTDNMARYGAQMVSRESFIGKLRSDLAVNKTNCGKWTEYF
ncbi:MAG: leucyl/phenylalanyl-tRNA--protein transferase [Spirochaetales bacterium]|nr:leucyl/phenylalanyl-tRNA--protein transferase [Spirochaetales bacterium]